MVKCLVALTLGVSLIREPAHPLIASGLAWVPSKSVEEALGLESQSQSHLSANSIPSNLPNRWAQYSLVRRFEATNSATVETSGSTAVATVAPPI